MIESLAGRWTVKQLDWQPEPLDAETAARASADPQGWIDAEVPGCIHLDLLRAGAIPDPFYGTNDLDVAWVAERSWLYRRTFDCPPQLLQEQTAELVCLGLDTFATVFLNGRLVGSASNMFRPWRWDVAELLRPEGNDLLLLFESPVHRGRELARQAGRSGDHLFGVNRIFVRKAQYASGWDWGPDLNTSGVWMPIYLEAWTGARLADVGVQVDWADPDAPVVRVEAAVQARGSCTAACNVRLACGDSVASATRSVDLSPGASTAALELVVDSPKLWWPAGLGPQHLYDLSVSLDVDGATHTHARKVGLRRVELVREPDEEGESFVFHVNGRPVFCRGANWIPADSFVPRVSPDDYERLVTMAADANMNMLRVWGGGIYERPEFYEACDRLGIMVWQDFMFACAAYPEHLDWFRDEVRREAQDVVRRLRNHPCIVLWCGNNECQWLFKDGPPGRLYTEVLAEVCAELDPGRPYWPGSPYGGDDPNDPTRGDQHNWQVWWEWKNADSHRSYNGRFLSEFGFQAPPTLETIAQYIPPDQHYVESRVMEHHQRAWDGTERLFRHLASLFRVPCAFRDLVYVMQLYQGEALKPGIEHWRSRKPRTAGTLFWQLNDCWPVVSWSAVDYALRPKALYYYAARFFAPVLALIDRRHGRLTFRIVNDLLQDFEGELTCGVSDLDGTSLWLEQQTVTVPADGVLDVRTESRDDLPLSDPTRRFVWCRLTQDGRRVSENTCFLAPYKHIRFPVPEIDVTVCDAPDGHTVELSTDAFAKGVWLTLDGTEPRFSDNFIDLLPGSARQVHVATPPGTTPDDVRRRLALRTLADLWPA
jgi:beta-mannosidase